MQFLIPYAIEHPKIHASTRPQSGTYTVPRQSFFLLAVNLIHKSFLEDISIALKLRHLTMMATALMLPIYAPTIGVTVFLRI